MNENHIKLMINEDNLLNRLGEAFTNKDTFIKEIMQNAQRSGATKLEIRTSNNPNPKIEIKKTQKPQLV